MALKEGDFPIIIGNGPDSNQTKQCISALKKINSNSKILMVGGLETNSKRKSQLTTLVELSGLKPNQLKKDICFFSS